jgi:lipoate-protein ligase A
MWQIETHRGSAAAFHARELPDPLVPTVWWFEVASSALVLGSSQPMDHVDVAACARRGVEVVRRRSGGGAVLLQPGDAIWADVLLPRDHPRWTDDIGRSAWWLGECWQAALESLGVTGAHVHRGPMVRTAWSAQVCFAGIGGGEVIRGGGKIVGISQRRTRTGARFQCALYRTWRAEAHSELFSPPAPTAADLADVAVAVDVSPADLMQAFAVAVHTI